MTVGSSWCNPARSSWPPWEVTRVCGRSFVSCFLKISLSSESCSLKTSTGHELSRRERRPWGSTPAPEKDALDFFDGRRGRGSELRDTRGETPPFHSRKSPLRKRTTRPLLPERRVGWCLRSSDLALGLHRPRHVLGRLAPHLLGDRTCEGAQRGCSRPAGRGAGCSDVAGATVACGGRRRTP